MPVRQTDPIPRIDQPHEATFGPPFRLGVLLPSVTLRGGLRLNEALQLLPKDLDGDRCTVRVLHGKGDKARLVGLDDGAWAILQRWMDRRAELGITGHRRVFCTLAGDPLQA